MYKLHNYLFGSENMKKRNLFKIFIGLLSLLPILASGQGSPPPYVVLVSGDALNGETNIDIPAGYLVEFVSLDLITGTEQPGTPGNTNTFSRIEIQGNQNLYQFEIRYTSESIPDALPKFQGPAQINIQDEGGKNSRAIVGLKIVEYSETNLIPTNTVVIPTDASGPVEIILESSEDLITWTAATPGTYGSSAAKRFFRVRSVLSQN